MNTIVISPTKTIVKLENLNRNPSPVPVEKTGSTCIFRTTRAPVSWSLGHPWDGREILKLQELLVKLPGFLWLLYITYVFRIWKKKTWYPRIQDLQRPTKSLELTESKRRSTEKWPEIRSSHNSLDWFCRENLNRKPWFLLSNIGLKPVNFPIIQFYECSKANNEPSPNITVNGYSSKNM